MGKRIFFSICFIFSLDVMFALSDASVLMNFYMSRVDYSDVDGFLHREETAPFINLDFSNYNLLFLKNHIGFFEHLNFHFTDDFFMEFLAGPAVGARLSPRFSVQGGLAFHMLMEFSDRDVNGTVQWGRDFQKAVNFQMGLSHDIQLKIHMAKFLHVLAGFSVSIDFGRVEELKIDGAWYFHRTKDFNAFSFSPYFGLNVSF